MDFDIVNLFPNSQGSCIKARYYKVLRDRLHQCIVLNNREIGHSRRLQVRNITCEFYLFLSYTLDREHYNFSCDICGEEAVDWRDSEYRLNYNVRPRSIDDMDYAELYAFIESNTTNTLSTLQTSSTLHLLGCLNKLNPYLSEESLNEAQKNVCVLLTRLKLLFKDFIAPKCECSRCSEIEVSVYDTPVIPSDAEDDSLMQEE